MTSMLWLASSLSGEEEPRTDGCPRLAWPGLARVEGRGRSHGSQLALRGWNPEGLS